MSITVDKVLAAAEALQKRIEKVDAQIAAKEEAAKARREVLERSADTRRCIIAGRWLITQAKANPRTARATVEGLSKFITREVDRKAMEPLLEELRKVAEVSNQ